MLRVPHSYRCFTVAGFGQTREKIVDERDLKASVLTKVRQAFARRAKPIVTAEYTLGSSGVRADLAMLDDAFVGVEIKSAGDTLRRLPSQLRAYSEHFDLALLVIADCHLPRLKVSDLRGAGLWSVKQDGTIVELQAPTRNAIAAERLAEMLTQQERRDLLRKVGSECTDPYSTLRGGFDTAFRKRYGSTSEAFWRSTTRRTVRAADLALLSRYAEARDQIRRLAAEQDEQRRQWVAQQLELESA